MMPRTGRRSRQSKQKERADDTGSLDQQKVSVCLRRQHGAQGPAEFEPAGRAAERGPGGQRADRAVRRVRPGVRERRLRLFLHGGVHRRDREGRAEGGQRERGFPRQTRRQGQGPPQGHGPGPDRHGLRPQRPGAAGLYRVRPGPGQLHRQQVPGPCASATAATATASSPGATST